MVTKSSAAASGAPELVIFRVFDAPRETVFAAWTDPSQVARWWGPQGFSLAVCETDIRPGGTWRRCLRGPDGAEHWLRGVYREIVAPERLVFTYAHEDAAGNPGTETLVTVTFAALSGRTRLTLRQTGFATIGDRDAHRDGWSGALERFAEYLTTV